MCQGFLAVGGVSSLCDGFSLFYKEIIALLSCCPLLSSVWEDDSPGQLGAPAVALREKDDELGLGEPWRWEEARLRFHSKGRPFRLSLWFPCRPSAQGPE